MLEPALPPAAPPPVALPPIVPAPAPIEPALPAVPPTALPPVAFAPAEPALEPPPAAGEPALLAPATPPFGPPSPEPPSPQADNKPTPTAPRAHQPKNLVLRTPLRGASPRLTFPDCRDIASIMGCPAAARLAETHGADAGLARRLGSASPLAGSAGNNERFPRYRSRAARVVSIRHRRRDIHAAGASPKSGVARLF